MSTGTRSRPRTGTRWRARSPSACGCRRGPPRCWRPGRSRAPAGCASARGSRSTPRCSCSPPRCCCRCWSRARAAGRSRTNWPRGASDVRERASPAARRPRVGGGRRRRSSRCSPTPRTPPAGSILNRIADYLAGNLAGVGRALVVVFLLADRAAARPRGRGSPRRASCSRSAPSPPRVTPARPSRASRASSTTGCTSSRGAVWLGGIVLLVALWWPVVRFYARAHARWRSRGMCWRPSAASPAARSRSSSRPASSAWSPRWAELSALWDTDYGRLLTLKIIIVGAIAAASFAHALRLRPRLLAAEPASARSRSSAGTGGSGGRSRGSRRCRRRRRRASSPSRSRRASSSEAEPGARRPVCDPCPLPRPAADELAVAGQRRFQRRGRVGAAHPAGGHGARSACSTSAASPRSSPDRRPRRERRAVRHRLPALPPAARRRRRSGQRRPRRRRGSPRSGTPPEAGAARARSSLARTRR